jgi:DNA-binding transcriptional LysR family regulator
MLDTRRMFVLAEVYRRGSVIGAAEALNCTASAVSQQVSKLEAETGQVLVRRDGRSTELTEAGRVLVTHADRIERELALAEEHLDDLAGLRRGSIHLGTFPTVAASVLPVAVRAFRKRHPDIELRVRSARIAGLIDMLQRREVEMSLMWEYEWSALSIDTFELTTLFEDPTMLLVPDRHQIAQEGFRTFADLADQAWITRTQHPVADLLVRLCRAANFSPNIVYEASDYQESQAMVAVGLGIAIAPQCALSTIRSDIVSVGLGAITPKRRIVLASLRGERLSPAAGALARVLVAAGKKIASVNEGRKPVRGNDTAGRQDDPQAG